MRFEELARYQPRIETLLRESYRRELRSCPRATRPLVELSRGLTLRGGKRLRALLLLAGYHVATGRPPTAVLEAAAALEHFQSWMLIHDDVMDHAEERRGGPTVHRSGAALHRADLLQGSSEEFGIASAITLGDLEEPLTVEGFLRTKVPAIRQQRALVEYSAMTRMTAYGQLLDIRNSLRDAGAVRESEVLKVHELKSALYTVASPLRLGALLGGGTSRLLTALGAFGRDVGIAFQLRDDILGAGLVSGASGKSANDLTEGKRTLLVVRAWARASLADRERLRRVLGNLTAPSEEIDRAREILRSTGSVRYSERMIERLARRGIAHLGNAGPMPRDAPVLFREVTKRLVERTA